MAETQKSQDLQAAEPIPVRVLAEQAFSRAAGAPLVPGNSVRILRDATENYPAWLDAIRSAGERILFENYIVADDDVGREFVASMTERARAGVRVCVVYDWLGSFGHGSSRLWQPLIAAGGEVRIFNPPRAGSLLSWPERDHRKAMAVDGRIGYVSGLCVSQKWKGDPAAGVAPWRDTGIEVQGPAVEDIEDAFADVWAATGAPLPEESRGAAAAVASAGSTMLRVLATSPSVAATYRLDQLIAAMARRTLWLADAYFVGVPAYVQALRAAAMDGVDVRLLVPGASDVPVISPLSRAGYRPLLEAGVRVFEWNGPMMHAKTAVADGRWARIGSSNLNLASWIANYELDVAVEDEHFGALMESIYEEDLANATEIVLLPRNRVRPAAPRRRQRGRGGSASRAAAGALRIGNTVGAAIANRRILGPAEAGIMAWVGAALLALAAMSLLWPVLVVVPLAVIFVWTGVSLLIRARELRASPATPRENDGADSGDTR